MLIQPLLDKLSLLRLSAFRQGLEEQLHNPQYADLCFEERLALLVDLECIHRDNNRLQRRLKKAQLHLPATLGLIAAWFSNSLKVPGSAIISMRLSQGPLGQGKLSLAAPWATQPAGQISLFATSEPRVSSKTSNSLMQMALTPSCCPPLPNFNSSSLMIGCEMSCRWSNPKICSISLMIAMDVLQQWLLLRSLSTIGSNDSRILLLVMQSLIASSTMLIGSNYLEILKDASGVLFPCRPLDL